MLVLLSLVNFVRKMKLVIRIFISLYIFLLAGFSQLHASVQQDNICFTPEKILERANHSIFTHSDGTTDLDVKSAVLTTLKVNDKVDTSDNEDEDEKLVSLKKSVDSSKYLTTTLYNTQSLGYFSHSVVKRFNTFARSYKLPSQKWYILFSVFRI